MEAEDIISNFKFDVGLRESESIPLSKRKTIAFLLGAGFSVPKGYPTAKTINNILTNLHNFNISFSEKGSLNENSIPVEFNWLNSHQGKFEQLKEIISKYKEDNSVFNYEIFYDFLTGNDAKYNGIKYIFNQIVASFLKDVNGNSWYDNEPNHFGYYDKYDEFLKFLQRCCKDSIVNIHTLNHDLFFESFNKTEYLSGQISDGFTEIDSPYYGVLKCNNGVFNVRLQYYNGKYNTPLRLYKLHGSLDYLPYYDIYNTSNFVYDNHIKIRNGIAIDHILKENSKKGDYDFFPFAYHSDFLTGTTSKILRYNEPFFRCLFDCFKQNLQTAEKLIIVGYSGGDSEINKMIIDNYDFRNKETYIVNRSLKDRLKQLAETLNARTVIKSIECLTLNDFE